MLNLAKALLLLERPAAILGQRIRHGLSYPATSTNTDFAEESITVNGGAFRLLYELEVGSPILVTRLKIGELLAYCSDVNYQYSTAGFGSGKLTHGLAGILTDNSTREAWMLVGVIDWGLLSGQSAILDRLTGSYEEVARDSRIMQTVFTLDVPLRAHVRYFQGRTMEPWGADGSIPRGPLEEKLISALLPNCSPRYFPDTFSFDIPLIFESSNVAMTEMLAIYAVMFYLSSLVRYRPDYLESILYTKPAWLIESFVESSASYFLRMMISRIVGRDLLLTRR